jgi:hypothetical protein
VVCGDGGIKMDDEDGRRRWSIKMEMMELMELVEMMEVMVIM